MEDVHVAAAQAVIDAYGASCRQHPEVGHKDLWRSIARRFHRELLERATSRSPARLAEYLSLLGRRDAGHGYYLGRVEFDQIVSNRRFCTEDLLRHLECLIRLGEAIGCLPAYRRQPGTPDPRLSSGLQPVLEQIEHHIGFELVPPPILGGVCGIVTDRGILHMRHLNAAYAAWRLHSLCRTCGAPVDATLCEIGAGAGFVPYYCSLLGISDFTIVDLPNLNIVQGYFLRSALGSERVRLYAAEGSDFVEKGVFRVLPGNCFRHAPQDYFTGVLNQDSLTEIEPSVARDYLRHAERNTKHFILSINPEFGAASSEEGRRGAFFQLAGEVSRLLRIYRFPYWLRDHYVEELWAPTSEADSS